MNMLNEFKKFISGNNLIKPDDKVLLAVSGGIDSMVMAHLFQQSGYFTGIVHCNFSLRAGESDKDEDMVRRYSEAHNIPFFTRRFETKAYAKRNGISIQMAARELRYSWFEEVRKENKYDLIAVAHNLNDNIETLIINLTRGTGLTGLSGIRVISNRIIRPLLFASRKEISEYCSLNRINYREDKSNADTKYIRNKIRHKVIPVLKEINPSIESTLNETAERFSGINEIVSEYILKLREKISEQSGNIIKLNISLLRPYLHNKAILFELFRPYGIANVQLDDLIKVINGKTGGQLFTATSRIIMNRKEIIISNEETSDTAYFLIRNINGLKKVQGIDSATYSAVNDNFEIPSDPSTACIDAEKIVFPLIIRKWKSGDFFFPLGMKQKKKLSDYFIDNKYSIIDKESKFIMESEAKIVWIIGERIDDRYKITGTTKKALIIRSTKKALVIKRIT
jgi:tRNA(Ile)-lysidine synthase